MANDTDFLILYNECDFFILYNKPTFFQYWRLDSGNHTELHLQSFLYFLFGNTILLSYH